MDYIFSKFADYLPGRVQRYEQVVASGGCALEMLEPKATELNENLTSRNQRCLGVDPETYRITEKPLRSENAFWQFNKHDEVV